MDDFIETLAESLHFSKVTIKKAQTLFRRASRTPPLRDASPTEFPSTITAICALYDATRDMQANIDKTNIDMTPGFPRLVAKCKELSENFRLTGNLYRSAIFQPGECSRDGLSSNEIEKFYRNEYTTAREFSAVDAMVGRKRRRENAQHDDTQSTTTLRTPCYSTTEKIGPNERVMELPLPGKLQRRLSFSVDQGSPGSKSPTDVAYVATKQGNDIDINLKEDPAVQKRVGSVNQINNTLTPPKRRRKGKKQGDDEDAFVLKSHIFGGLHFILATGGGFSIKQADILSLRIKENAGSVQTVRKGKNVLPLEKDKAVVIIAKKFAIAKRKVDLKDDYALHTLHWVDSSIKSGKTLSKNAFTIPRPVEAPAILPVPAAGGKASTRNENLTGEKLISPVSIKGAIFACEQTPASKDKTPKMNKLIIDRLTEVRDNYKSFKDQHSKWRVYGYDKAIKAIRAYPREINTVDEARRIPRHIGKNILSYIKEIVLTGHLAKADAFEKDEHFRVIKLFREIWGAGPDTANQWYDRGLRSLDDLRKAHTSTPGGILTHSQVIGLKYYSDFQLRIPRDEVTEMENQVKQVVEKENKNLGVTTCGSYRRGKATCGDVDILICGEPSEIAGVLHRVVSRLHQNGFLTDDLTFDSRAGYKYMGVCQPAGKPHRRIDLIAVSREEYPYSLLYFTGNAYFNRYVLLRMIFNGITYCRTCCKLMKRLTLFLFVSILLCLGQ